MANKKIQLMSENGVDNLYPKVQMAIDGNNILASGSNLASYTATQDCFISFYSSTNVNSININGSNVWFGQTSTWMTFGYYLMKGSTISFGSSNQVNGYKVFGLM